MYIHMAKASKDARNQLGEPLATDLQDFCAAHFNCPTVEVIRRAVREYIDRRLEEKEERERFEQARRNRLAGKA